MKKAMKFMSIILVMLMIMMSSSMVFADEKKSSSSSGSSSSSTSASEIINDISDATNKDHGIETSSFTEAAGKVIDAIRLFAIIAGVIIIVILGIKFMLGSVEQKAEYQKHFIPLIVGIVVIMAATSIASFLFSLF